VQAPIGNGYEHRANRTNAWMAILRQDTIAPENKCQTVLVSDGI